MNALGANTVYNHADYRLMSRRALEGLAEVFGGQSVSARDCPDDRLSVRCGIL